MNRIKISGYKKNYIALRVASLFIFVTFAQSCNKSDRKGLHFSNQPASFELSLKPHNCIAVVGEHSKVPISMIFKTDSKYIQDIGKFRIKSVNVQGGKGHLETEKGEVLKNGLEFGYKDSHQFFFVPKENSTPGPVAIEVAVGLFEQGLDPTLNMLCKKASCDIHVQYKKDDFEVNITKSDQVNTLDPNAIPIELTIESNNEKLNQSYIVSGWSITGGIGKFCKKNGESIPERCSERLGLGKNTFAFIPDENTKGKLSLSVEVTNTITNAQRQIPVTIDLQKKSVVQDKEFLIDATLRMIKKNNRSHKTCKLELDISSKSPLASELQYKVLAIQLCKGSLRLTEAGPDLKHGDTLKFGKQKIYFHTDNFSGNFQPLIFISTSKGKTIPVVLQGDRSDYEIEDSGFSAKGEFKNNRIVLTLGGRNLSGNEEWILENWFFKGGIEGELQYAVESRIVSKNHKYRSGTILIHMEWNKNIQNISSTPMVMLNLVHPSGIKEIVTVDLSGLVFPVLESRLNVLKSELSNSLTSIDYRDHVEAIEDKINQVVSTRKDAINEAKRILEQLGYLFIETSAERSNIDTLIRSYGSFLIENKKAFAATAETVVVAYQAAYALDNALVDISHPAEPLFRLKKDKLTIDNFLTKVKTEPRSFNHLKQVIETIRQYVNNIDVEINRLIDNGVTQYVSPQEVEELNRKLVSKKTKLDSLRGRLSEVEKELITNSNSNASSTPDKSQELLLRYASTDGDKFVKEIFQKEDFHAIETLFDTIKGGIRVSSGVMPLFKYALRFRNVKIIDFLISKGITVSEDDIAYYIINHWEEGNLSNNKIVKSLLKKGADFGHEPLLHDNKWSLPCDDISFPAGKHSHAIKITPSGPKITLLHLAVFLNKKSAYHFLSHNGLMDKSIEFSFMDYEYTYRDKYGKTIASSCKKGYPKRYTAKELIALLGRDF